MKVGPSHRIIEYEEVKARPEKARQAIKGSPSPRKVFAIILKAARDIESRVELSAKESEDVVETDIVVCRTTMVRKQTSRNSEHLEFKLGKDRDVFVAN